MSVISNDDESTSKSATMNSNDAEAICKLIKDDPAMLRLAREALGFNGSATMHGLDINPAFDDDDDEAMESNLKMIKCRSAPPLDQKRRVILACPAETVARQLPVWTDNALNSAQIDLNRPTMLPLRAAGANGYVTDPPLSEVGRLTARLLGRAIKDSGYTIDRVYSSPDLRCLQTAASIRDASLRSNIAPAIEVEPGLLGNLSWLANWSLPSFESPVDENRGGIAFLKIRTDYDPVFTNDKIRTRCVNESVEDAHQCNRTTIIALLNQSERRKTILIVADAMTMNSAIRFLLDNHGGIDAGHSDAMAQPGSDKSDDGSRTEDKTSASRDGTTKIFEDRVTRDRSRMYDHYKAVEFERNHYEHNSCRSWKRIYSIHPITHLASCNEMAWSLAN